MIAKVFRSGFVLLSLTACTSMPTSKAAPQKLLAEAAPDSVISRQLDWFMSILNDQQGKISKDEINSHFHSTFLSQISADQVTGIFLQLHEQFGAIKQESREPVQTPEPGIQTLVMHASSDKGGKIRITLSIDVASGQINGLFLQPDATPGPVPVSLKEADDMLKSLAPDSGLLVAEVKNGVCLPVHQLNASRPLAIGSSFKLYVLLALVDQIRQKKLSWDDSLVIQSLWKSLPSGTMQNEPEGKSFSIQKFAEQMISISDNTATDHLLYKIGREQVEAAMAGTGHKNAGLNIPFLSTKEFFTLKFQQATREAWLQLDASGRKKFLDDKIKDQALAVPTTDLISWKEPREIKRVEWFAAGDDICQTMAGFLTRAANDKAALDPALAILSKNPGLPAIKDSFRFVGFKGGSEPGVFSLNWLLQREDQRWFVVSLTANDSLKELKQNELLGVATGVLQQVGSVP